MDEREPSQVQRFTLAEWERTAEIARLLNARGVETPPSDSSGDEDGLSGDRESRNPKILPTTGAAAIELSEADSDA